MYQRNELAVLSGSITQEVIIGLEVRGAAGLFTSAIPRLFLLSINQPANQTTIRWTGHI